MECPSLWNVGRFGATASAFFTYTIGTTYSVRGLDVPRRVRLSSTISVTFRESIGRISRATYWPIPHRNLALPSISLWEHDEGLRRLKAESQRVIDEDKLIAMVLQQRRLVEEARTKTDRRRRGRQLPNSKVSQPLREKTFPRTSVWSMITLYLMNTPGFTAELALYADPGYSVTPALQPPTSADPGITYEMCMNKCMNKGKSQFQCREQCGGSEVPSSEGGESITVKCAKDFWLCTASCQLSSFPWNLGCEAFCFARRLNCNNPF
jgi:hypothetical protein